MGGRIRFHYKGFNELRRSAPVRDELMRRGHAIAEAAGEGFELVPSRSGTRARAVVIAVTPEAKLDEARNGSLTRALGAGRG